MHARPTSRPRSAAHAGAHGPSHARGAGGHRLQRRAEVHWQRGRALAEAGHWHEAALAFEQAAEQNPAEPVFSLNAARAWMRHGALDAALRHADRVIALEPGNALARQIAVRCLRQQRRHADVARCLQGMPEGEARDAEYHRELGHALLNSGQPREAVEAFFRSLSTAIDDAHTHYELGLAFNALHMKVEAAECFRTALALGGRPGEIGLRGLLTTFERDACRWPEAQVELAAFREAARRLVPGSMEWTTPFVHATLVDDPLEQLAVARSCAHHLAAGVTPLPPANERPPGRLRLGYVSGDFHEHATSILMAEVLEQHDRGRFEVVLYSHGPDDGSAMRERMRSACEHFVELRGVSDRDAALRIRADAIDVLIDLKGYTLDHRLPIFAHRPAPVQASYLGYPGTTGAGYIDYVIGDAVVTPLEHAAHFSEHIAQLPGCYQPNDRQRALREPPARASVGLPADALVLCGFNQPYKISPEVFDAWCELLHALPQAVLWLLQWNDVAPANLVAQAAERGIGAERLVFAPRVSPAEHIARLQLADVFIDTWPCNAHTTASDALWAGVPVVTCRGEVFASRVAASLCHAVGVPELACDDLPAYREQVLTLARDPARRAALRTRLARARDDSPLFDSLAQVRALEALVERMAARHERGLPPAALPAEQTKA